MGRSVFRSLAATLVLVSIMLPGVASQEAILQAPESIQSPYAVNKKGEIYGVMENTTIVRFRPPFPRWQPAGGVIFKLMRRRS